MDKIVETDWWVIHWSRSASSSFQADDDSVAQTNHTMGFWGVYTKVFRTLGSSPVNCKSKRINSPGVSSRIWLFLWRYHWSGSTSDITVENAMLSQLNVADLPFQCKAISKPTNQTIGCIFHWAYKFEYSYFKTRTCESNCQTVVFSLTWHVSTNQHFTYRFWM